MQELEQSKYETEEKLKEMELITLKKEAEQRQYMGSTMDELEHLKKDKELFNMETEVLKKSVEDNIRENTALKEEVRNLSLQKKELDLQALDLKNRYEGIEKDLALLKSDNQNNITEIIVNAINENQNILKNAIHEVDNPALSAVVCTPDYFKSLTKNCTECLKIVPTLSHNNPSHVISASTRIAHIYGMYIIHGRATSNKSPDILFGESK